MLTKRSVTGLIATAVAAGAIISGALAVTSGTYQYTKVPAATYSVAAFGTLAVEEAYDPPPGTCHDM